MTDLSAEEIQEAVSEFSQEPEAPQESEIFVPPEEKGGVTEPDVPSPMAEEEALPETMGITESSVIGYNPPARNLLPGETPGVSVSGPEGMLCMQQV